MNMHILFYNFHKLNLEKEVYKLRLYFQAFTPKINMQSSDKKTNLKVKEPLTQANEYGKRQKVGHPKLPLVIGAINFQQ